MPDLEHYFTMDFWALVHQAEIEAGLALSPGKGKQREVQYRDDVFQVWTPAQHECHVIYITKVGNAIEQIIAHAGELLLSHVKAFALQRFNLLFSGVVYGIRPILMTTGLVTKFEEIDKKYLECFCKVCLFLPYCPHPNIP